MTDEYDDQTMEDESEIPNPDPQAITIINNWLDDATDYGSDLMAIQDDEQGLYRAVDLAVYAGVSVEEASAMLQSYRNYNWWMDERCFYVIAHEGHYGPGAPWRLQSTAHPIPEKVRRAYRLNQIRHLTWDFYDHAKKEVKSFGAEIRQALIQVDAETVTVGGRNQRLAIRDYARDLLQNMRVNAQTRANAIINALNIPRAMRDEYYAYFFDGFWPYVEVMIDEEVQVLEDLIAATP